MPAYPDLTPAWLKPENASVLDAPVYRLLRALVNANPLPASLRHVLPNPNPLAMVKDPQAQILALMQGLHVSPEVPLPSTKAEFRPMPLYHGTAGDIKGFETGRSGSTSGSPAAPLGVFAARNPAVAEEFADLAAAKGPGNGQNILSLLHRSARPARLDLQGSETGEEIAATLADAWDHGYDAVLMTNYTSPKGLSGQQIVVVKDPAQLRLPTAAFDPTQRERADLLASLAPLAVAGGLATPRPKQPAQAP